MTHETTPQTITLMPAPALMTAEEVCTYLGIGLGRLAELIAEEGLPCTRLGKGDGKGSRRTFHRALVDQWVLDRIKGPKEVRMSMESEESAIKALERATRTRRASEAKVSEVADAYRVR